MGIEKKYFDEINIARGIVVITVLLGHSFPDSQVGIKNELAEWIVSFIYSFHMGVFFFLSGFVGARKMLNHNFNFFTEVKRKFNRLMIPYLFFSFVTLILKQFFSIYANNPFNFHDFWKIFLGINPNGGLWYLWTLFFMYFIYFILSKINFNSSRFIIFGLVLLLGQKIFPNTFMDPIYEYSIYFSIGIAANEIYKIIISFFRADFMKYLIAAIFLLLIIFSFIEIPYFFTCVLSIVLILYFSWRISNKKNSKLFVLFKELGNQSYGIYLISYYVQIPIRVVFYTILSVNYWFVVVLMFNLGLIISFVLCKYVLKHNNFCDKIMLGNF